jgi:catechol 2,3-dioxygenase-like lactoylglutathione lyase family enzyme
MSVRLNHTIVPARDKTAAARFFAQMIGLVAGEAVGPLVPVQVDDVLTLEFDDADRFEPHHYGFLVGDAEFDAILERVRAAGVLFGASPEHGWNRQINHVNGGRGFYFQDPNGHSYEVFTRR